MYKYFFSFLITILLFGCGGDEEAALPTALSLNTIGNKTITIGDPALNFSLAAFDPDGLDYSFDSFGRVGDNPYDFGANFTAGTGTFSWDVTNVAAGDYFVTFSVVNSALDTDSEEVQITVLAEPGVFTTGAKFV